MADRVVILSDKPTRVHDSMRIDLPRPRAADAVSRLALLEEVERSGVVDITKFYQGPRPDGQK